MARKYGLLILCGFLAAALLASEAQAQPGGGRRGGRGPGGMMAGAGGLLTLAENAQVQKELEIVDDQKTKLTDLATAQRTAMRDLGPDLSQEERTSKRQKIQEDSLKKLGEILLPKQLERLKQIQLQVQGADALSNEDVVKALNITDDQKAKMKTISDEAAAKLQDALANLNGPERFTKMQELNKGLLGKLLAVLTPDQVAKFDTMKGPKLDIDPATLMRGNRGARGGGGRRGGGGGGGGAGGGAGG